MVNVVPVLWYHDLNIPPWADAVYAGLHRHLNALCAGWLLFACCTRNGSELPFREHHQCYCFRIRSEILNSSTDSPVNQGQNLHSLGDESISILFPRRNGDEVSVMRTTRDSWQTVFRHLPRTLSNPHLFPRYQQHSTTNAPLKNGEQQKCSPSPLCHTELNLLKTAMETG